jgi:hypothetical protein
LREKEETDVTLFVSMAIARDGGNLFTENRLEKIRQRMEKVEATTVSDIYVLDNFDPLW